MLHKGPSGKFERQPEATKWTEIKRVSAHHKKDPFYRAKLELQHYRRVKASAIQDLLAMSKKIKSPTEAMRMIDIANKFEADLVKTMAVDSDQEALEKNPEGAFAECLNAVKDELRSMGYMFEEDSDAKKDIEHEAETNVPDDTEGRTDPSADEPPPDPIEETKAVPDVDGDESDLEKEDLERPAQPALQRVHLHEGPPPHSRQETIPDEEEVPLGLGDIVFPDETPGDGEKPPGDVV